MLETRNKMDLIKELLEKLKTAENGCSHLDFDTAHPLSSEQKFNTVLDDIRVNGLNNLKEHEPAIKQKFVGFDFGANKDN